MSIELKRHHRARLMKNRRISWGWDDLTGTARHSKVVNTRTPCSCWMCGNPRKYSGEKTIQELRAAQDVDQEP